MCVYRSIWECVRGEDAVTLYHDRNKQSSHVSHRRSSSHASCREEHRALLISLTEACWTTPENWDDSHSVSLSLYLWLISSFLLFWLMLSSLSFCNFQLSLPLSAFSHFVYCLFTWIPLLSLTACGIIQCKQSCFFRHLCYIRTMEMNEVCNEWMLDSVETHNNF